MGHDRCSPRIEGQGQRSKSDFKSQDHRSKYNCATLPVPRAITGGIRSYGGLGLELGSQFETRSVGPRSSIEDVF